MRIISSSRQRMLAQRMTLAVIALQGALLVTLAVTPGDPPAHGELWQLLWAASRKPTFYPLAALLLAGPPLSILAGRVPGRHRRWLIGAWAIFLALAGAMFGQRLAVMMHILWWRYGS